MLNNAKLLEEKLTTYRHDFHKHPEIGFQEFRTSEKVVEILNALGFRVRQNVGKTGVVAEIGESQPIRLCIPNARCDACLRA
jgi:metal-dependent amidase/aminoacylase/carboxypeptidase family protein